MPAPQLHLSFGLSVKDHREIHPAVRAACAAEPTYVRLGAIFHDLPYYGNMLAEAIRYGLKAPALDEGWAYRMHSVRPAHFVASYLRAAARTPGLTRDERIALGAGLLSHCALDLTLHPLVNYCARRDVARFGGHESVHHRLTEKYHALFHHLDHLGHDPIGTATFRTWTRVTKQSSLVTARVEGPLVAFVQAAYRGAYGDAPNPEAWGRWVRSFAHFGALVGHRMAARNSEKVRRDPALFDRYYDNDRFRFREFYARSEARLPGLVNLAYAYMDAGDFSAEAEEAFVRASRIDDLAEPVPQAEDGLPNLPHLRVVSTPGVTRPTVSPPALRA